MTEIIIATLIVYVIHLMLPSSIAIIRKEVNNAYLVGPRDDEAPVSNIVKRARRASGNLQESLLIFLPLAIMVGDNATAAEAATIWLGLRLAYLVTYLMGLSYVRTLVWFASLLCLLQMGSQIA